MSGRRRCFRGIRDAWRRDGEADVDVEVLRGEEGCGRAFGEMKRYYRGGRKERRKGWQVALLAAQSKQNVVEATSIIMSKPLPSKPSV